VESEKKSYESATKSLLLEKEALQHEILSLQSDLNNSGRLIAFLIYEKDGLLRENQELMNVSEEVLILAEEKELDSPPLSPGPHLKNQYSSWCCNDPLDDCSVRER